MKNAPKSLVVNPTVSLSTHDLIKRDGTNKAGTANRILLTMLVGAAEQKTATVEDRKDKSKKNVSWTVLGTVNLDSTFVIDGVECRLAAVKGFGGQSRLEIRAVTASAGTVDIDL
jgi:hypothetical protein